MNPTDVTIAVAVVPAGQAGIAGMQRVVLSFTPVKRQGCGLGVPFPIGAWPQAVEDMLSGMDRPDLTGIEPTSNLGLRGAPISQLPIAPRDEEIARLPLARAIFHDLRRPPSAFRQWQTERKADIASVSRLWQALLAPEGEEDWLALTELLGEQNWKKQFDRLNQPDNTTPDVVSAARGRAAALLLEERARSLQARFVGDADGPDAGANRAFDAAIVQPTAAGSAPILAEERALAAEVAGLIEKLDKAGADQICGIYDDLVSRLGKASPRPGGEALSRRILDLLDYHDAATAVPTVESGKGRSREEALGDPAGDPKQARRRAAARARLMAITTNPLLARLFNFTVDMLVPTASLPQVKYCLLAAGFACRDAKLASWTVTKRSDAEIWPCERAEAETAMACGRAVPPESGVLSVHDGFVTTGASCTSAEPGARRFGLFTLDIHEALAARFCSTQGDPNRADPLTLRSGGIAIVDHWRQWGAIADVLATRRTTDGHQSGALILDARTLQIGAEVDVGYIGGKGPNDRQWRTLMARTVRFDPENALADLVREPARPGDSRSVQSLIEAAVPNATLRAGYAAATMAPVAKLAERYTDGEFEGETAFCEDVLGQWTGGPMGIDPGHSTLPSDMGPTGRVTACDGLALSITYGLPYRNGGSETDLLPRQIFGLPYWLRLRARFAGGVARPPSVVSDDAHQMPARREKRRYLRHERIEAPLIVAASAAIRHVFDDTPDGLRETASLAVMRTGPSEAARTTFRFVVPPAVSARFADQHDAFADDAKLADVTYSRRGPLTGDKQWEGQWHGPKGGLTDVDYDDQGGGFGTIAVNAARPSPVFAPHRAGAVRRDPYYPDPAADFIVLALTDIEGRRLAGRPLVVPVRPTADVSFPDVRPVAIEIEAAKAGSFAVEPDIAGEKTAVLDQERFIGVWGRPSPGAPLRLLRGTEPMMTGAQLARRQFCTRKDKPDASFIADTVPKNHSGVAVTHVVLSLPPGAQFEILAWCLPSVETLLARFDCVEGLAALRKPEHTPSGPYCTDGMRGLTPAELTAAARDLHALLRDRIAPEIAATSGIKALHGIRIPEGRVSIAGPSLRPIAIAPKSEDGRTPSTSPDRALTVSGAVELDRLTAGTLEILAEGPALVSGAFDDPARARSADEAARGLWPRSRLDDQRRTPEEIYGFDVDPASGKVRWPNEQAVLLTVHDPLPAPLGLPPGATRIIDLEAAQQDARTLDAALESERLLADFAAATAALHEATATIEKAPAADRHTLLPGLNARAEALEEVRAKALAHAAALVNADGSDSGKSAFIARMDRLTVQAASLATRRAAPPEPLKGPRVEIPARINDARARVLSVRAIARSRTATLFRAGNASPSPTLLAGDARPGAEDGLYSGSQPVIVRARVRPARPSPLTIRPAFALEPLPMQAADAAGVRRALRLRIRLRRPWFGSGAGERLGIVIWPPAIHDRIGLSADTVARDGDTLAPADGLRWPWQRPDMDFSQWSDQDIGPGGAFVTRWGADPIRAGRRAEGWLLQPSQFPDLPKTPQPGASRWQGTDEIWGDEPRYVPSAVMPLPADIDGPAAEPSLTVGLMTYLPRFDLDAETWFVDVPFDPLDAVDPFLRIGLVRFQPYAATAELAVSEPHVEWVQVPPCRTLTATRDGKNRSTVTVTVEGAGSTWVAREQGGSTPSSLSDWLQAPLMRMRIVRRWPDGREAPCRLADGGYAEREDVPLTQDELNRGRNLDTGERGRRLGLAVRAQAAGLGLRWQESFRLHDDNAQLPEGVRLAVVVEEVHAMRPATYANEPHRGGPTDADPEILAVTGPRFAASVELA